MSAEKLQEWLERDVGALRLVAIMIDSIAVGDHVIVVALGIDEKGKNMCSACGKEQPRTPWCAKGC